MKNRNIKLGFIDSQCISILYKIFFLIVCGYGICLHISPSDIDYNVKMFSYFTVLSNLFCFIITLSYIIKVTKSRHTITPALKISYIKKIYTPKYILFKGTSLMGIILTFLIYHFMVAKYKYPLLHNNILNLPTKDLLSHYVTPLLYILDWLLFQPKNINTTKSPILWMWYPLLYLATIMLRAFLFPHNSILYLRKFPYFFLDVTVIGFHKFAIYIILILASIIAIGYSILGIEQLILRLSNKR